MGLDCFVMCDDKELWYGRKENEIHGRMQRMSGIPADEFNCVNFQLTLEILEEFLRDAVNGKLTHTKGFFFGGENDFAEVVRLAEQIYDRALPYVRSGGNVYYTSWW